MNQLEANRPGGICLNVGEDLASVVASTRKSADAIFMCTLEPSQISEHSQTLRKVARNRPLTL